MSVFLIFMAISNLTGDQRTAMEIQARKSEAMQALGPVVENMITDDLRPSLKRIYGIAVRKGLIDPRPDSLKGLALGFDFVSTLALAQKAAAMGAMERMASLIGNLTSVFPDARDKFNTDEFIDEAGSMMGTPETILFDADTVAKTRQQRNQAAQQERTAAMVQHGAKTAQIAADSANVLSQTQIGGGATALQQLMGGQ